MCNGCVKLANSVNVTLADLFTVVLDVFGMVATALVQTVYTRP